MNSDSQNSYSNQLYQASKAANELPLPGENARQHSDKLAAKISLEISKQPISFQKFMEMVLYEPGLGYYAAGSTKLGESGDFITAPEISSLFSFSLAKAILPALDDMKIILEAGAGSGVMAADILYYLDQNNALPGEYWILELSADLRERQQATIKKRVPHLLERVTWLDTLPAKFSGIVIANELLDAMPVQLFKKETDGIKELFVDYIEDEFILIDDNPANTRLTERVREIEQLVGDNLPGDYISEINFAAEDWVKTIANHLEKGMVILIDYGFPRHEYYHSQRDKGTLICHYRHRTHANPFFLPGLQDITAHVDFTAMADAALESGMKVMGYTSQVNFLMGAGITEIMNQADSNNNEKAALTGYLDSTSQVKKLTLPHEMGELFKVIGLTKNFDKTLPAFTFRDMREYL